MRRIPSSPPREADQRSGAAKEGGRLAALETALAEVHRHRVRHHRCLDRGDRRQPVHPSAAVGVEQRRDPVRRRCAQRAASGLAGVAIQHARRERRAAVDFVDLSVPRRLVDRRVVASGLVDGRDADGVDERRGDGDHHRHSGHRPRRTLRSRPAPSATTSGRASRFRSSMSEAGFATNSRSRVRSTSVPTPTIASRSSRARGRRRGTTPGTASCCSRCRSGTARRSGCSARIG